MVFGPTELRSTLCSGMYSTSKTAGYCKKRTGVDVMEVLCEWGEQEGKASVIQPTIIMYSTISAIGNIGPAVPAGKIDQYIGSAPTSEQAFATSLSTFIFIPRPLYVRLEFRAESVVEPSVGARMFGLCDRGSIETPTARCFDRSTIIFHFGFY